MIAHRSGSYRIWNVVAISGSCHFIVRVSSVSRVDMVYDWPFAMLTFFVRASSPSQKLNSFPFNLMAIKAIQPMQIPSDTKGYHRESFTLAIFHLIGLRTITKLNSKLEIDRRLPIRLPTNYFASQLTRKIRNISETEMTLDTGPNTRIITALILIKKWNISSNVRCTVTKPIPHHAAIKIIVCHLHYGK